MTMTSSHVLRRAVVGTIGAAAVIATFAVGPAGASAGKHHPAPKPKKDGPVLAGSRYLALGDSVPFGYIESNATTAADYAKQKNFTGFPEDVAANLGLKVTNAACPGETTASFLAVTAQSNGCENEPGAAAGDPPVAGGYRTAYPLHAKYKNDKQSQMAFATAYLKKHPKTSLISIMIGANDGFICIEQTSDDCESEISTVQATVEKNLGKILKTLRKTDGYTGQIVVVDYYSTNYTDVFATTESTLLNQALAKAAAPYDVETADGFGTFQSAAKQAGGDTCNAQLLTALTPTGPDNCGVHPSLAGQALLAQAVEQAIKK